MKLSNSLHLFFILSLLILSSCEKDKPIDSPERPTEIPEVFIRASINGTVVDESENPLKNIIVQTGINTSLTDENGVFTFNNIETNENGTVVNINQDGYFKNTKVITTNEGETSITKIMLVERNMTASFDSSNGGKATMNGGATVELPAEGVRLESGSIYTGSVNVYATYLDPTSEDLNLRMPGDLRATNTEDETVKLVTYGMVAVELEGDNGEALNVAEGQTATIEMPVPDALLGSAPETIPLWYFDELRGYWIEDGVGTLTDDNTYVGTVTHFTYWNYDLPYPFVSLEGKIKDSKMEDVSGVRVDIATGTSGETLSGFTGSDGFFAGYIPADQLLTLTVYDECVEVYSSEIGPFSEDTVLPAIVISEADASFITVSGILHDCNDEIETNGYVLIDWQTSNAYITVGDEGSFSGTVGVCDKMEVTISGISNNPFSQGTTTLHDITGLTELEIGIIKTCW